jgi:hypothetical protein
MSRESVPLGSEGDLSKPRRPEQNESQDVVIQLRSSVAHGKARVWASDDARFLAIGITALVIAFVVKVLWNMGQDWPLTSWK